jgi:nucleosome assembly protein 1-like 1
VIDDEEEALYRELEFKYDKLYKEIYEQRSSLLLGTKQPAGDLLAEYENRAKQLDDEDYKKVEVNPVDVKDIQNTPLGVPGFWLRAMLNHGAINRLIQEKDRPILMHLQDVQCNLHDPGYGFDLIFTFEKNDYFKNETLKKSFVLAKQNVIEKCEGTEIEWKDGKDVTKKKIKKKQKAKKGQPGKTITKTVEQESFFNFFKTITMPDEETLEGKKPPQEDKDEDEENPEKDVGEQMDEDFDLGNEFKDQLIPLALEYYLEVIEEDDEDEDGRGDSDCDDDHGHKPSKKSAVKDDDEDEEDEKPKGGKKGGKKGGAAGGDKQQECKQQ